MKIKSSKSLKTKTKRNISEEELLSDTIPTLTRFKRPSEFISFSETLNDLVTLSELKGIISFEEILELTYTAMIEDGEDLVTMPYLVRSKSWSTKNKVRDEAHQPKKIKAKYRKEYRRLVSEYKTSPALLNGYSWHTENLDLTLINLYEKILENNEMNRPASTFKVIARIIECIVSHEVRTLTLPFDDSDSIPEIPRTFKINSSFIKKRIQRKGFE